MKKITFKTTFKKMLADIYTPVGIYLRLRDRFRDSILLESADSHAAENGYSIIGINAIAGIEITDNNQVEYKFPMQKPQKISLDPGTDITNTLFDFLQNFEFQEKTLKPVEFAQGLYGYTCYDAVTFFDRKLQGNKPALPAEIPLIRYRLYQYVIVINHFKDELFLCENHFSGLESEIVSVESLIKGKDVPVFPFSLVGEEMVDISDESYKEIVKKGIASCLRGDVFQVVLSRRFQQQFYGDEFNVYRALRSINPGPYLFYFDYGDYKLMGSSPESQLVIERNKAIVHPIAGTIRRTGADDNALAEQLKHDVKENAEHIMLVDLARNDLSKVCIDVKVNQLKKVTFYSHVIHLVSEVEGTIQEEKNPFKILVATFPAGTLSGAPKYKAMQLINEHESVQRSFYGGMIGFIGFNGSCNHAIMIRTFLSKNNSLVSRAGAGVVAARIRKVNWKK